MQYESLGDGDVGNANVEAAAFEAAGEIRVGGWMDAFPCAHLDSTSMDADMHVPSLIVAGAAGKKSTREESQLPRCSPQSCERKGRTARFHSVLSGAETLGLHPCSCRQL